ncbi:5-formyltetrahydrofolate cyclo-ligase [Patellaria atrata CBS 101060]|uniref:5-formyltetrahydrofolate cyclo-ligase n=1 Tax=Patellaria atrata CBS 101060 TaxID=1346257 RepID=A0A9P4VP91_9PEZI|nr:5-formyltetrahydrofolate cyclo-ligase [Patellaria atrata CBS 101060]
MTALRAAKRELRKVIKDALSAVSEDKISGQTATAIKLVFSLPEYQSAKRISIYLSMPTGEISTGALVHDALEKSKKVFIPHTYKLSNPQPGQPSSVMDMIEIRSIEDYEALKLDKWGIPTLDEDAIDGRVNSFGGKGKSLGKAELPRTKGGLDLIVMPGMVFDLNFGRLGHGKGFYDFFLDRYQQYSNHAGSKMPFLVGLTLIEQLLPANESVPMDTTDWRLDALITGDGHILRSNK